jgi:hypothetical protein
MDIHNPTFLGDITGMGKVKQIQHAVSGSVISGSTIMYLDDSIPINTEGFEILTCSITPGNVSNILLIIANLQCGHYVTNHMTGIALFQDSIADALASGYGNAAYVTGLKLFHKMLAGTISQITFKIRVGPITSGTTYINTVPAATGRCFGGVSSSTLTIIEFGP